MKPTGGAPSKRSGQLRRLIQIRAKFKGAQKRNALGYYPVLKLKPFAPKMNFLSPKTGKKHRKLKPNQGQVDQATKALSSELKAYGQKELQKIGQKYLNDQIKKINKEIDLTIKF